MMAGGNGPSSEPIKVQSQIEDLNGRIIKEGFSLFARLAFCSKEGRYLVGLWPLQ
jgi:hypothetical protein